MLTITVHWEGPQFENHSIANVNRKLCSELAANPKLNLKIVKAENNNSSMEQADLTISHQWPPNWNDPESKYWVVMQPWEYGAIPKQWYIPMKYWIDEVWVYSSYNKECYIRSGIPDNKIHVIPLGVDGNVFNTGSKTLDLDDASFFRFLFVGGTIGRKGIDTLLGAYLTEFSADEDVCLVIKDFGSNSFYKGATFENTIKNMQSNTEYPKIVYINDEFTEEELAGLYTACNCLVHPYRGEGFGLPIVEAMACGVPVIVPDRGPSTDFCNENTAFFVSSSEEALQEKKLDGLDTVDYPWWLKIDLHDLRKVMRYVYTNQKLALEKGQNASQTVLSSFTWKQSADRIAHRIHDFSQRKFSPKPTDREIIQTELGLGIQLIHQNLYEAALEKFLCVLAVYPDSLEARYNTANTYINQNQYLEALPHLRFISQAMDKESNTFQAEIWSLMGVCYSQMQTYQLALEAFKRANLLDPSVRPREILYLDRSIETAKLQLAELYEVLGSRYLEMRNEFRAEEMYTEGLQYASRQPELQQGLQKVREQIQRTKENIEQQTTYEVLWQSPVYNLSGYAEESRSFIMGLQSYPLKIKLLASDEPLTRETPGTDMYSSLLKLEKQQLTTPLIHYQSIPAHSLSLPRAPLSIGRTMFETDSLPRNWVENLKKITEVWVPSEFNRESFTAAGLNPERIYVLPASLDENKYNPDNIQRSLLRNGGPFRFLSVFDWSIRKGWDILLRAYFEEFRPDEDVVLELKVNKFLEPGTKIQDQIAALCKKLGVKNPPPVRLLESTMTEEELISTYAAADCFVLPSRGEGWGRPYMEAMAMKLPTIGTRWSGQLTYMNDNNSYLIDIEGVVPVNPDLAPFYYHGQRWAEPSVDHLKILMRSVFERRDEARRKGQKARADLFPKFSIQYTAKQIYERLDYLVKYHYGL
ncbi:glycosyltransferase [Paenibacillus vini]|uniref:Glycosyl transferase family 1 domain-containing protein n=1 Tax=Paenibacillus vini TaxID=1476024 RepID=A0ABQ4MGH1_9BACL|nr:glycosyltransferase [Paenibacillus vini]GIP55057.1 hypothetical protein J42TS3_40920 [Paenibacillus vini]